MCEHVREQEMHHGDSHLGEVPSFVSLRKKNRTAGEAISHEVMMPTNIVQRRRLRCCLPSCVYYTSSLPCVDLDDAAISDLCDCLTISIFARFRVLVILM